MSTVINKALSDQLVETVVYNNSGGTWTAPMLCYVVNGSDGTINIVAADNTTNTPATHILLTSIANGAYGSVYKAGTVTGLNTGGASGVGAQVYLGTSGNRTLNAPTAADTIVQNVGFVTVKHSSAGAVFFRISPPVKFGTSNLQASSVGASQLGASFGFTGFPNRITESLGGLGLSESTDYENADTGADGTGNSACAAYTTVNAGAWTVGSLSNPDFPRNILISIKNDSGGPLNLYGGVMTFHLTGMDFRGSSITEDVTFTSEAGNKSVATANWRLKYSLKAFQTLTDCTLDNKPDNGLKIAVGVGSKIALGNDLTWGEGDINLASKGSTKYDHSNKYSATYGTLDWGSITPTDILHLTYWMNPGGNVAAS